MKKVFFIFIAFTVFINILCADESDAKIFESTEKSVVYVEVSLFLSKEYFSNQEMVKKIEKKYNYNILDSFLPVQSGSGFFITSAGYLLTNNHVIFINNLDLAKVETYNSVIYNMLSKIPDDVLNAEEYKLIKTDIKKSN